MFRTQPYRMLLCAAGLMLGLVPSLALAADSKPPTPTVVAKAPSPEAPASPAKATSKAETSAPATSASPKRIAQATDATGLPVGVTAAEWVDLAQEYAWYQDWTQARRCLSAAAALDAAGPEAGVALALGALTYGQAGDSTNAALVLTKARGDHAGDAVAALCDAIQVWMNATDVMNDISGKAAPVPELEQTLASVAQQWKGTFTGGWAGLRLVEYYVHIGDADKATATCQALEKGYQTGLVAEEAVVLEANTAHWVAKDLPKAKALYAQAAEQVRNPRLRLRALVYLVNLEIDQRECDDALAVLANIDTEFAGRPGLPWARLYRGNAAYRIGQWDLAEADAQAFLESTSEEVGLRNTARRVLGEALLGRGQPAEAEAVFAAMLDVPAGTWGIEEAYLALSRSRLARNDPAELLFREGMDAYSGGDYETATWCLAQVELTGGETPGHRREEEALFWRAESLFEWLDPAEALTLLTAFVAEYPESRRARLCTARIAHIQQIYGLEPPTARQ